MGVSTEFALWGSLGFIGVGIVGAFLIAGYVNQKTKDQTMKRDNAK
jgi:hypothetical protein